MFQLSLMDFTLLLGAAGAAGYIVGVVHEKRSPTTYEKGVELEDGVVVREGQPPEPWPTDGGDNEPF